jgi:hypothetical protein
MRSGDWVKAGVNTGAMIALCFVGVALGFLCASVLNRARGA